MSRNAYVRLGPGRPRSYGAATTDDSLLFVDVCNQRLADLRHVTATTFAGGGHVLVRGDGIDLGDVSALADRLGWNRASTAIVRHVVGNEPHVTSESARWAGERDKTELLRRARAVELMALLEWSRAVWRPQGYHYLLPSGRHAPTFVKLADALRSPRDAHVLASWLLRDLKPSAGIILDSGTLTPLALALEALMVRAGLGIGEVKVLDEYPRTALDALAAVKAVDEAHAVIGVISVSSSGNVRDRLAHALQASGVSYHRLHVLVDASPTEPVAAVESWLPFDAVDPAVGMAQHSDECRICRDDRTASLLVAVNPWSFQGMLPDQRVPLMPRPHAALENRRFFELLDAADAVGVHEEPSERIRSQRPPSVTMGVRFRIDALVSDDEIAQEIGRRTEDVLSDEPVERPDLVLVSAVETGAPDFTPEFNRFWSIVRRETGLPEATSYPLDHEWPDDLVARVKGANSIKVFAVGAVTGASLQKALVAVQSIRRADPSHYELSALIAHARPPRWRDWETLLNSYGAYDDQSPRLRALWLVTLPDRSPLDEESRLLNYAMDDATLLSLGTEAKAFFNRRHRLCGPGGGLAVPAEPLFWGSQPNARVTPHSIFGEGLRAPALFAAVGAAMERARVDAARAGRERIPELRQFEMRAIVRSYYDPLIIAAIFRWLRPWEADWGDEYGSSASSVIGELLARVKETQPEQLHVLLPELLIAAALGKIDSTARDDIVAEATRLLETLDPEQRAPVEVALAVVDGARDRVGV